MICFVYLLGVTSMTRNPLKQIYEDICFGRNKVKCVKTCSFIE